TMVGKPDVVVACNCIECQKRSGSVFGMSSYWPKASIESIAGESKLYRRISVANRWVDFHFCPACGSSVFWYVEFDPKAIGVAVGNFGDPSFPKPSSVVWSVSQHPWVVFPADCASFPDDG